MRLQYQISAITKRLFLGPFLTPSRAAYLRELGVTHVLNVCEAPSIVSDGDGDFCEIRNLSIEDLRPISDDEAITCVTAIHEMLQSPEAKVYVHCIAGQNRSPTILWLYLIACGLASAEAKASIEANAVDAVPGHKALVDDRLAAVVREYGLLQLRPVPEGAIAIYE